MYNIIKKGGDIMIKTFKIKLIPTEEQEILMWKTVHASRFVYNWALENWNRRKSQGDKTNGNLISKDFTKLKKQEEFQWLNEVSARALTSSISNLDIAFKRFFNGQAKYPRFKTKRKSKKSFHVRQDRLYFKGSQCKIEKIGFVSFKSHIEIPKGKYLNPSCVFDGKYWFLNFALEIEDNQTILNENLSIGIDLGIKELAVVNILDKPIKNINKTKKVKNIEKRLKRKQRRVARKYLMNNVKGFNKTKNIIKMEKEINLLYRKLYNIRHNHIHQSTSMIIKMKPYRVVMEDLNVSGMMRNRSLAKALQDQCLHEFIRQMKYKCEWNGIEFVQADRFYPSSKTCSCCGNIKKDLKLKDRIYKCDKCGLKIDRDKNASINLGKYKLV